MKWWKTTYPPLTDSQRDSKKLAKDWRVDRSPSLKAETSRNQRGVDVRPSIVFNEVTV